MSALHAPMKCATRKFGAGFGAGLTRRKGVHNVPRPRGPAAIRYNKVREAAQQGLRRRSMLRKVAITLAVLVTGWIGGDAPRAMAADPILFGAIIPLTGAAARNVN